MSCNYLSWFLLLFALLELVVETHLTIHDSRHAFISSGHDHYIMQDISSIHEDISDMELFDGSKLNLRFEPEYLDFKQRPLGVPHVEKVRLINADQNRTVDMTSISGSTVHFHSSFFENKKIPPLGNTTFNVVFLGREEGSIESSLYIHTTEGHLKYKVKGASVYSPYRLRPIVGVKLPINTSFSPLIYMHNPHSEPIQIVEVYSSGGDFHLELPSGELEGPKDLWEIPPLETKAIIRVRFHAKTEQNNTAYIRIKLNNTEEILVVPLEVEVTPTASLYHPQGSVDFGVGGSLDPAKKLKLLLKNTSRRPVKIQGVVSSSKSLTVDYDSLNVHETDDGLLEVATLTLDWRTAFEQKDFSGKITIRYKNGKARTEIPYYVTIVDGGITFNASATKYFVKEKNERIAVRTIDIRNDFPTPIMLIDVSLAKDAQSYFQISDFKPSVLKSKESRPVFKLNLRQNVSIADVRLSSCIVLRTNISEVELPLLTYDGQLEMHLPYKTKDDILDLGLISSGSTKETYVLLSNKNPVSVSIKNLSTSLLLCNIDIVGCDKGDFSNALLEENYKNSSKCVRLKPNDYVVIRLTIKTPQLGGISMGGAISIRTQYEEISIPVYYRSAQGKLEIDETTLVFDQCFPGKICSHPLKIRSTFNDPMVIEDIVTLPPDPRVTPRHDGHIAAKSSKTVGLIELDPTVECQSECYLGVRPEEFGEWTKTFALPNSTTQYDINLVNTLYNRFLNLTPNKARNVTMRLDTSEVRGYIFRSLLKMSWPSLVSGSDAPRSVFQFPLTQIGNVTYRNLTVRNPSSVDLLVQLVADSHYPNSECLSDALSFDFFQGATATRTSPRARTPFFFAGDHGGLRDSFARRFDVRPHAASIPIVLAPGENFTVGIGYDAKDSTSSTAFVFIRNNLTVVEVAQLRGRGAHPSFKFGNRKPGASQTLLFDFTEKHLRECERTERGKRQLAMSFPIRRTFNARNTGDVKIHVNNFYINGYECEGYGFRVLNCEPFVLPPNGSRKIDIEFTPDFTLQTIQRCLVMETSMNVPVNYTLEVIIPFAHVKLCANLIARPSWELYVKYSALAASIVTLIFVIVAASMEAGEIYRAAVADYSRPSTSAQPTLDLKQIGAQARAEIRSKIEPEKEEKKTEEKKEITTEKTAKNNNNTKNCKEPPALPSPPPLPAHGENVRTEEEEDDEEERSQKYTALIPVKSKRKVAKTKSNEALGEMNDGNLKKPEKFACNANKRQVKEKPESKPESTNHKKLKHGRDDKKGYKKENAKAETAAQEEETSSTTTESSTNDDEKLKSGNGKKQKTETPPKPDDPQHEPQKPNERKRFTPKNKVEMKPKENPPEQTRIADIKDKPKPNNRIARERKEKHFNKRNEREKNSNKNEIKEFNQSMSRTSPLSQSLSSSPSMQNVNAISNVWSENRATFSDVVSRSEAASSSTSFSPPVSNQIKSETRAQKKLSPNYVEQYGKTAPELGPIGSRKEFWQENVTNTAATGTTATVNSNVYQQESFFNHQNSQIHNNSYFSNNVDVDFFNNPPDLQYHRHLRAQQQQQQQQHNLHRQQQESLLDVWSPNSVASSNYWGSALSSVLPTYVPPPQLQQHHPLQQMRLTPPQQQPLSPPESCWTWGSPVWQPLGNEVAPPRTPTRTPPGFAPHRDMDDQQQQFEENVFRPFNIWNQQQNPWNFPHNQ